MENYILILLTILVVLVIAIVYFGYRQLGHLRMIVGKNSNNISALQSILSDDSSSRNHIKRYNHHTEEDLSSVDNIDVSDSDSELNKELIESDYEMMSEFLYENDNLDNLDNLDNIEDDIKDNSNDDNIIKNIEDEDEIKVKNKVENKVENKEINITGFMDKIDEDINQNTKTIEIKSSKKVKKTVPNESPKDFEAGHQQVSDNDGNKYEIIMTKNGIKRWKKV